MASRTLAKSLLLGLAAAQQISTRVPEVHPKLTTWKCTKAGGCVAQNTSLVLDQAYRKIVKVDGTESCVVNGALNTALCPDEFTCAKNCAIEGADYAAKGVVTNGDSVVMRMYVGDENVTPRVYLLGSKGDYENLQLLNQEISFDVDVSKLPCGMNGALYLGEMRMDGGRSDVNPAGAALGTGYCDAQCPKLPFIDGAANIDNRGACCNENDLWEANSRSTVYTPHPCSKPGVFACIGDDCGSNGVCDKAGCSYNAYKEGIKNFYGPGGTIDTNKPFTVVTQFLTTDNTTAGALREIRRVYVQGGKVIPNAKSAAGVDSVTDKVCDWNKPFHNLGELKGFGEAAQRGMVLTFSIWNDVGGFMKWLDQGNAGPCNATEGDPAFIKKNTPDTSVTFSKVKWGDIGTTYAH